MTAMNATKATGVAALADVAGLLNAPIRILVISPNWIGDAIMAQPLLRLLKDRHPESVIDVLTPGWVAPVWRTMDEVDGVMETPFRHGPLQLAARRRVAKLLRQHGYAEAYVLPNTMKFALIPWLADIPRRIGYRGELRYGLLNVIHRNPKHARRPMVSFYAALAEPPSQESLPVSRFTRPRLSVSAEASAHALANAGLDEDRPLVIFAPGAEFGSAKRWPPAHFARLAGMVLEQHPESQIVLLGSGKDREVCEEVRALAPEVVNLAGATSLDQAIALIAGAAAVVSNDSGLLHIASALNRPVVAIYGPTDPAYAPPFSDMAASLSLRLDCSPCKKRECPLGHHNCMRQLGAELVWKPLAPMLAPIPARMTAPATAAETPASAFPDVR